MVNLADLFATGGTLASYAGLGITFMQWSASARERKSDLTIRDYLEWLRRQDHESLRIQLEGNHEAIEALEQVLDGIKNSVLYAIAEHEMQSEKRHDAVVNLLDKAAQVTALDRQIRQNEAAQRAHARSILALHIETGSQVLVELRSYNPAIIQLANKWIIDTQASVQQLLGESARIRFIRRPGTLSKSPAGMPSNLPIYEAYVSVDKSIQILERFIQELSIK